MTGLVGWLFIGGLIGMIVLYGWPIFVAVAGLSAGIWMMHRIAAGIRADLDRHRAEITAVIKRADRQHNQIIAGDEIGGTYGQYLPPQSLR